MGKKMTLDISGLSVAKDNSIASCRKDLLNLWDWEKNSELELDPYNTTVGMRANASWLCPEYGEAHRFEMSVFRRARSKPCPYCSGRRILEGFNDLATTNPELAKEWLYALDGVSTPQTVTAGSHKEVMWECSKHGTRWVATISDRSSGKGCQKCRSEKISKARSRVISGKSLAELYPDVAEQWDYELNDKTPDQVMAHAKESAHWICGKHDEPYRWEAAIYSRTSKELCGCPKCATERAAALLRKPSPGESLAERFPESRKEFLGELNDGITAYDVYGGSDYKYTWKCAICGETWDATPCNRTSGGKFDIGCPTCKHKLIGEQNAIYLTESLLKDTHPELLKEWDYELNDHDGIDANAISTHSNKIVNWICQEGHRYSTSVNHRTTRGDGCSICAIRTHVSYPEKALYYYISQACADAVENARPRLVGMGNMEFDIWIPSVNVAVEYDGRFWHQDEGRDIRKDKVARQNGVKLIRVREPGCAEYDSMSIMVMRETVYDAWSLDNAIREVLGHIGCGAPVLVDTARDEQLIRQLIEAPSTTIEVSPQTAVSEAS